VRASARDGHGGEILITEYGPGGFSGEVGLLSRRPSYADGLALTDIESLCVNLDQLHALLVAEAVLGEKIMRALILRRVALLEAGAGGPVLIGAAASAGVARLRHFLSRNAVPHVLLDPANDADGRTVLERYGARTEELPLVICPDGTVLRNPTEAQVARCIGMLDGADSDRVYDLVVAGAGPAGLSVAVYAASEGLSVLVVEARAVGGQAGASARIENYLGFPTGISGQALTGRAFTQAVKFGTTVMVPREIRHLECAPDEGEPFALQFDEGGSVRGRAVVIATGARYRRPECSGLQAMEGRGVWYWASPIEARMCAGEEVVLVGGGNSAGQAAVFLAQHAKKVWMLVRGPGLAASMSKYLIDRIANTPNIELRTRTEISDIDGLRESGIRSVSWTNGATGQVDTRPIHHVFLFLGADPATDWLRDCDVALDDRGFVMTGSDRDRPLQTTVPGVFAVGDVRAGSVKRVGGAIGEGAAAVAQIHPYLARHRLATAIA